MLNILLTILGHLFVVIGVIGFFLPFIPGTPFLLLALWCYAKSSARFHKKLIESRWFGPVLRDWSEHGRIRLKAKLVAIASIASSVIFLEFFVRAGWYKTAATVICITAALYILSRPSQ